MQHRITIKTLASPQSTHLVRFCIFQCMLVFLLDLWNLFDIFNFLCINYFLNCMCVPWCICYPQKVRRGHETPQTWGYRRLWMEPRSPAKAAIASYWSFLQPVCIFKIQFYNIFMNTKSQVIQEFHCKTSWAPFSDCTYLSAPLMTMAWEPLDLPPPLRAAISEIITFEDRPLWQRRTSVSSIGLYRIALSQGLFLFG